MDDDSNLEQQLENEAIYRQLLVKAVLAVLLPTEDLENPCLTALVEQILSELIIGNVIGKKASQPWLLYEGICTTARVLEEKKTAATQRIVSGNYSVDSITSQNKGRRWSVRGFFLLIIQLVIVSVSTIRFLVTTAAKSTSLPLRITPTHDDTGKGPSASNKDDSSSSSKAPFLEFKLWSCVGELVQLSSRMPWAFGCLSLLRYGAVHGPGQMAGLNQPVDR